jgi:hypothetical protein
MDNFSGWDDYTDNYSDDSEHMAPKSFDELKKEKLVKKYTEYCEELLLVIFI